MILYIKDNKDDVTEAVHGLDIFTKNWCMNCSETYEKNDLIFRCNECEFSSTLGKCLIKSFALNHESDYNLGHFGSMGSH